MLAFITHAQVQGQVVREPPRILYITRIMRRPLTGKHGAEDIDFGRCMGDAVDLVVDEEIIARRRVFLRRPVSFPVAGRADFQLVMSAKKVLREEAEPAVSLPAIAVPSAVVLARAGTQASFAIQFAWVA